MPQVTVHQLLQKNAAMNITATLKVQAIACTVVIPYQSQDGKDDNLMKLVIGDTTGTIPVIVNGAQPNIYKMLQDAVDSGNTLKLRDFRLSNNWIYFNSTTAAGALAIKQVTVDENTKKNAKTSLFASISPLKDVKKTSNKKRRLSITGTVTEVPTPAEKYRKVFLADTTADNIAATLFPPHNENPDIASLKKGDKLTLYDCKYSTFHGGSVNTSAGTMIQVDHITPPAHLQKLSGTIIGYGAQPTGLNSFIEFQNEDGDEESYILEAKYKNDIKDLKTFLGDLPAHFKIHLHNNNVTQIIRLPSADFDDNDNVHDFQEDDNIDDHILDD